MVNLLKKELPRVLPGLWDNRAKGLQQYDEWVAQFGLVGLGRVELPTFPTLSGRSSQPFDLRAAFHTLHLPFALSRLRPDQELFSVEKLPWAPGRGVSAIIMFLKALSQIPCVTDIVLPSREAPKNMHMERGSHLVGGPG
jgi:hypothetical protein